MYQHASKSRWFKHYHHEEISPYPSMSEARQAETIAIDQEQPLYNKKGLGRDSRTVRSVGWNGEGPYRSPELPPTWNLSKTEKKEFKKRNRDYRVH